MSDYSIAVKYAMIFFMVTMAIEWVLGKWMKKHLQPYGHHFKH